MYRMAHPGGLEVGTGTPNTGRLHRRRPLGISRRKRGAVLACSRMVIAPVHAGSCSCAAPTGAAKRSAHTQAATIPARDFHAASRINHTDKYALLYTSNALLLAELPSSGKTCATKANCKQPTRPRSKPSLGVVCEFTYPHLVDSA